MKTNGVPIDNAFFSKMNWFFDHEPGANELALSLHTLKRLSLISTMSATSKTD